MAKFFENNLRPEEKLGGYNVGEPDDDIFQIKDKEYPDDIQDFVYTAPEVREEEQIAEPIIEAEVDDIIEDIPQEIPIMEEVESKESEVFSQPKQEEDSSSIWNSFGDEPDETEDLLSSVSINPVEIIEVRKKEIPAIDADEPEILTTKQDISFELDDDFKRQLAEQLEAKKAKKKAEEPKDIIEQAAIPPTEFIPIEEVDNAQFFDLSNYGNDRPSENSPEKNTTKEQDSKTENKENDKKKKSKLPWIIGISAASIVVLAGIAYLIMYYLIPNFYKKDDIAKKDSTVKVEQNVHKEEHKKVEKEVEKPIAEKEAEKEVNKESEKEVKKETEEEIIARINKEFEKKSESKPLEKKELAKAEVHVEKKELAKTEHVEKKAENKPEIKETKTVAKPKKDKVVAKDKHTVTKEKVTPPKKEEKKTELVKETKPTQETKKEENIIDAVYTIQVYSSPSKEDATDWVIKLKNKNIQATLSDQMIRDVRWYRVRFGSFPTREEAKAVALRYGFSQTWIDRVK